MLGVSQDSADGTWRGNIDAEQMGGYVEYRAASGAANPGRVHARLARLALPPSEASSVENLLAEAPDALPALDIVIDNFELRGRKWGRVELEAVTRGAREWRLTRLALTNPEARLTGSGQWQAGTAPRMVLDFQLDLADSGAFLDRLGFAGTLKGGKGKLGGQLSWAGSPLAFHVPSLHGKLGLELDNGQFLKAGPGAARLFSVLSLQSLPRRLALDFRDVFQVSPDGDQPGVHQQHSCAGWTALGIVADQSGHQRTPVNGEGPAIHQGRLFRQVPAACCQNA